MTKVYYYQTSSGNNPVKSFIDSLNKIQIAKLTHVLKLISEYGLRFVFPYTKKLTGTPLWEIRTLGKDNIRVIYATIIEQNILLLHGFIKKKQKTPSKHLRTALDRYKDWLKRTQFH